MNEHRLRSSKARGCATIAGIGVLLLLLLVWIMPDCTAGSSKAKKARALSPQQFQALHRLMTELRASFPEEELRDWKDLRGEDIPQEFRFLGARLVRVGEKRYHLIRLEGCLDHHLDMQFYGIGEQAEPGEPEQIPRITLRAGEVDITEEELWRQAQPVPPK